MAGSKRQRFTDYVRNSQDKAPLVSLCLPDDAVVQETLAYLDLPVGEDSVQNEIHLAQHLGHVPVFIAGCSQLLFPWQEDIEGAKKKIRRYTIATPDGTWEKKIKWPHKLWEGASAYPLQEQTDHEKLQMVCRHITQREETIRQYYRNWRQQVGEAGVIVLGDPSPQWLGFQISQGLLYMHWHDFNQLYRRSMQAIYDASLFVIELALEEGIDFVSASGLGLEIYSPKLFTQLDLPVLQAYAAWVHQRDGLFFYSNSGQTREFIATGLFNQIGADLIEGLAPPPMGDNDLASARRSIDSHICTMGNIDQTLLCDGTAEEVASEAGRIVRAVKGFPHIYAPADSILVGTPPENLIAFVETTQAMSQAA